jgi:predicted dehydrogenase
MKFLIIGLGSMGKRRIRNLLSLGIEKSKIHVFDVNNDRVELASQNYGVEKHYSVDSELLSTVDSIIISTPPDQHHEYAMLAVDNKKHCFIEASVINFNHQELFEKALQNNVTLFPSCTMLFYPAPRRIKEIIMSGTIGKVCNWQYQSGQYLPDWHPWESISDFYVSNKETGGCREIVPFELVWLTDLFGDIDLISCLKDKNSDIEADIDDVYAINLKHSSSGIIGQMMVDVISRSPVRHFRATGTKGSLEWSDKSKSIDTFVADEETSWSTENLEVGNAEKGYINPEEPYIQEMQEFISKSKVRAQPHFTMKDDAAILDILVKAESYCSTNKS